MSHHCSVFKNSCLRVPVDPISKMPKTAYERKPKTLTEQNSVDSVSTTCSVSTADVDAEKLKDFYRSIPDYNEINHLPAEQFYSTLKSLREKKKIMLGLAVDHIDECNHHHKITIESAITTAGEMIRPSSIKNTKSKLNHTVRRKYSADMKDPETAKFKNDADKTRLDLLSTKASSTLKRPTRRCVITDKSDKYIHDDLKLSPEVSNLKDTSLRNDRPKRNPSANSISWNDIKDDRKTEVDEKFDQFFEGRKYTSPRKVNIGDDFQTQSMPSSPLRMKRAKSPMRRRKSITVPKPFKMTERDEEDRIVTELRSLRKSFSDDMLHQKCERQQFRANPVPIESRIPLYDKILEDQAMRRAITKINSEAELRAQMKPFSFTKRDEKMGGVCERAIQGLPKCKKKKRFRARPFPKNLFSNYFYEKMREDEYFRRMNRRIRAEEMLKCANPPSSLAARERSRLSTPAAHSDLPIDPSPAAGSSTSSDRQRCSSPVKGRRGLKSNKEDFITTSPQPFKFNTADRAAKKMEDITRKIYLESKSSSSKGMGPNEGPRAYSALDLRTVATGRSNLAALLRAEAVRRRFDLDQARRLAEQQRRMELRARDKLLRSKPSWHLVKNNHAEDIAMRLQTRRDEERMRREEFLHEMELMYGRVQEQPMLFERYYAPRSHSAPIDSIQLSPRKQKKRSTKKNCYGSPSRSRKVSINDTPEAFNGDVAEYLNRIDNDDISDSEVISTVTEENRKFVSVLDRAVRY
ncbi:protein FAM161B [Pectinophora gossypiella]|uniref:protein FAM161B n=1 Tax=Pectinophora gossypiella TaxID=13191 RepID=UPI00214EEEED|nr:protein FAM161B [Pectinophora gossypiella]